MANYPRPVARAVIVAGAALTAALSLAPSAGAAEPVPPRAVEPLDFAAQQLGEPYVFGSAGPDSWDCSGLTKAAWAASGVTLRHNSAAQYQQSKPLTRDQLRPGDLVFWGQTPETIYHVALYLGDGLMINAARPQYEVFYRRIDEGNQPSFYGRP